ncbi:VIT domain-containing protein [Stigmatella sp. ncwal1]|uniref:VIT domain-containing protein n=1 Tax=Stigmatella ashevillensis TaxID=2995309 RepID=A0ABT5DDG3_9BACT|nr:VIT domain-containing protein [Stigmatella ashevillena]MDC0710823.1 VIT domain-containing protein [Stigmatella ashevillena]
MNTALTSCEPSGLYTREGAKVPLQGVEVTGELLGGHARVRVRQRYLNTERRPVEAVYVFPLPSDGTLTGFSMECNGRRLQGVVKEREEAFRTYDDAVTTGHGAALLDQERPNVFTAQVGNLLPDEETWVEVEFLQAIQVEEGSVRWMLPTLVAPRYIPGAPQGDRTAHGTAAPTQRVPDADRITPPIGAVGYGLKIDLRVDLGREVVVESPSHALTLHKEGQQVRVTFARNEVALDRDFVLTVRSPDTSASLTPLVTHRQGEKPGTFALTVVPDLLGLAAGPKRQEVVFVVDTSGSMEGESLPQAQGALRLCLRHLREGDRFNIIAFDTSFQTFAPQPAVFTQKTLEQADRWVASLSANGGTELLQPMLAAVQGVPEGVVVLLTDGQVGNETEILQAVLRARKTTRIYSFGIGTNVSDALLRDMARQTDGAVEFIHPGERIDDKVVAQFSRALAPRITELQAHFEGVEGTELAPAELPALVDAVPWTLLGRYTTPGRGKVTLKGRSGAEPFVLSVPVDFPAVSDRPAVEKLWAAERIRGWESAELDGRRAQRMKERIVQLAVEHQLVTRHTSFVVVEERTGERRASGQPETRVVPVNAPAGWAMFDTASQKELREGALPPPPRGVPMGPAAAAPAAPRSRMASTGAPGSVPKPSPARVQRALDVDDETTGSFFLEAPAEAEMAPAPSRMEEAGAFPMPPPPPAPAPAKKKGSLFQKLLGKSEADTLDQASASEAARAAPEPGPRGGEDATALLSRQLASGLWDGAGPGTEAVRQARATALALLELLRQGITSHHALHGAQVKKAVEALLQLATGLTSEPEVAELALGVAWLVAAGPRTRGRIAQAAQPLAGLSARIGDEAALRQHVDTLATR